MEKKADKKEIDYKAVFDKKQEVAKKLKLICPNANNNSGIYFYTRQDENGKKAFYIGKSSHILDRCISHDIYYNQRIDISIKKRGYYSEENPYGWKLNVLFFPEYLLNEKEAYYIALYRQKGGECYNVESGGTIGKEIIGERKPSKTYTQGVEYGEKKAIKQIKELFDKYLDCVIKEPSNKVKERKKREFEKLLKGE